MLELKEPLHTLIREPQTLTGKKRFPAKITIYDETLRDGEQMPGVAFTPAQKLQLARVLADMGIGSLMAAFPASGPAECLAYKTILAAYKRGELRPELQIMALARAETADIDVVARLADEAGVNRDRLGVLILSTTSDLHLKYKLGPRLLRHHGVAASEWLDRPVSWYRRANLDLIVDHIELARRHGFGTIEFAGEDASRGSKEYLLEWAAACRAAGGNRLCFSDTCGVLTPEGVDHYFADLATALPNLDITVHFHNDFGLAAANTVRALSHGANTASVTACGIGERAGNASLHQVTMALRDLYGYRLDGFDYARLTELRQLVETLSGIIIQAHEPIVGHNAFAHESGMHTAAMETHPSIYQAIDQRAVGGKHRLVYGKHSGRSGVITLARRHFNARLAGKPLSLERIADTALARIKELREGMAESAAYAEFVARYYTHLEDLSVGEDLVLAEIEAAIRREEARVYFMGATAS